MLRVSRDTCPSRDPEHGHFTQSCQIWQYSKSISSIIYCRRLVLIMEYESMWHYLNLIGPDFSISVSFLKYTTLKFIVNVDFNPLCSNGHYSITERLRSKLLASGNRATWIVTDVHVTWIELTFSPDRGFYVNWDYYYPWQYMEIIVHWMIVEKAP